MYLTMYFLQLPFILIVVRLVGGDYVHLMIVSSVMAVDTVNTASRYNSFVQTLTAYQ